MKERLIELIGRVQDCGCDFTDVVQTTYVDNSRLAEYLISQGVVIQKRDGDAIKEFEGEYAFLSNFYYAPVCYKGINYPTNEHYFQAMKTVDVELRKKIAAASTPGEAKRLGRHVPLRPHWEDIKEKVMLSGLELKFTTHPDLREKLLATGQRDLVEGNYWHDNEWGNCTCEKCKNQNGKNKLGICLMKVRAELEKRQ